MAKLIGLSVLLFVLGCVSACPDNKDYVLNPDLLETEVYDTKASGVCFNAGEKICSASCKQLVLCTSDGTEFTQTVVQNCTAGRWCDAKGNGSCHLGMSTCAPIDPPAYRLHCTAAGVYPDPYDCTVYHACLTSGILSDVRGCPVGWSYNALTTTCNLRFDSRACVESPIPLCDEAGQNGPVIENPSIYYICIGHITGPLPEFYRCAGDAYYEDGVCVSPPTTAPPAADVN